MKHWLLILFFTFGYLSQAQDFLKGTIVDDQDNKLQGVSVYYKNTTQGVTTNKEGQFQIKHLKDNTLIIQYLGFKTQELLITNQKDIHVILEPESVHLSEVTLDNKEDPAYAIIRKAIAKKSENKSRINDYKASFYSRGAIQFKADSLFMKRIEKEFEDDDLKDTIMGYLSETVSTIYVSPPDKFYEEISASKVSGEETVFSFNSAEESEYSFYENNISFLNPIPSPIANNALDIYKYRFEGDFYHDNQLINKINVQPKRSSNRAWSGTIYIVDDTSEFYGIHLEADEDVLQIPLLKKLSIQQNFVYENSQKVWVKNTQKISFEGSILRNYFEARFLAHYKDYTFDNLQHKFTREKMKILPEAIKTDDFWEKHRPIPLTQMEIDDYHKKDSIAEVKKSRTYLDSTDRRHNKLKVKDIALGYTYRNSNKDWRISYDGITSPGFYNTVQGLSMGTKVSFTKQYEKEYTNYLRVESELDYGFSDKRARVSGAITRKFNSINHATLQVFAGTKTSQFNRQKPISNLTNSLYTIIDNRNYLKMYDLGRFGASYFQEIFNGIYLTAETAWERRSPLYNTKIREKYADRLTSNDPLNPNDETSSPFSVHSLLRSKLGFQIRFAQDYYSHPNRKIIGKSKGPLIYIGAIAGTMAEEKSHNFVQLQTKITQNIKMGQAGNSRYLIHAGTFVHKNELSFADFQHFIGNETFVAHSNGIENFHMLPYYSHSTDDSYLAAHYEHHFKDAIMRKIPVIRALKLQLVGGANLLAVNHQKPYTEWYVGLDNIGIKSWRIFRVDYVQSYWNNTTHSGIRVRVGM